MRVYSAPGEPAELGAGLSLPGLDKTSGLRQLRGCLAVLDEHGKGPSRSHRPQLREVSDQQELRPRTACLSGQAVQGEGTGKRRFVNQE